MVIWVLRDGDSFLSAAGDGVPVDRVTSYGDICELHICEFADEAEARAEVEAMGYAERARWAPVAIDLLDLTPEDLVEHFDD